MGFTAHLFLGAPAKNPQRATQGQDNSHVEFTVDTFKLRVQKANVKIASSA